MLPDKTIVTNMTKSTAKQILSFSLTFIALAALATIVILFAEQYTLKDGKLIQTGMIEIKEIQGAGHDDGTEGDANAVTGMQPLHQAFAKIRRYVRV